LMVAMMSHYLNLLNDVLTSRAIIYTDKYNNIKS